jgi:hypothetical protein
LGHSHLDLGIVRLRGSYGIDIHFSQERFLVKYSFIAALALFAAACSKPGTHGASVDEAFRNAISPDTQTIVAVKVEKLKATDLYKRHQQLLNLPQFDLLAARAGFDPRRDVSSFCVVWDGQHMVLLAQGSLATNQIEDKLVAEGAQRTPYKGYTLFTRGPDSIGCLRTPARCRKSYKHALRKSRRIRKSGR